MSLNWQWKEKRGHIEWEEQEWNGKTYIYHGNALSIWLNEYDDNTWQMCCFFVDKDHLKRCCNDFILFQGIKKVVFYTWDKNNKALAEMLAKYHVTFEVNTKFPIN